jgi:hypothetical protein
VDFHQGESRWDIGEIRGHTILEQSFFCGGESLLCLQALLRSLCMAQEEVCDVGLLVEGDCA